MRFIFIIILFTVSVFPKGFPEEYRAVLDYSYNMEFVRSDSLIASLDTAKFARAYPLYFSLKNRFWMFLGNNTNELNNRFMDEAYKLYDVFENEADNYEDDYFYQFVIADAHFMKAVILTLKNEMVGSFWELRVAVNKFERTLELNPNCGEAKASLGMISYSLGLLPSLYRFAMSIAGIGADKKQGFADLREAFKQTSFGKCEAGYNLAMVYKDYVAEYDSAAMVLNEIKDMFPDNILFAYQLGVVKLKAKQIAKAEVIFSEIIDNGNPDKFIHTCAFTFYDLANVYFYSGKWSKASVAYNKFLETTRSIDFMGDAVFKDAVCQFALGDKIKYMERLSLAGIGNEDVGADKYAMVKSDDLISNGFTDEYMSLVALKNRYHSGSGSVPQYDLTRITNTEIKNGMLALSAAIKLDGKYLADAEKLARSVEVNDYGFEKWIVPLKYIVLTMCEIHKKNMENAEGYLNRAENFLNNEYDSDLQAKINYIKRNYLNLVID